MITKSISYTLALCAALAMAALATENVRIQEWKLPTANSLPHDPALGPGTERSLSGFEARAARHLSYSLIEPLADKSSREWRGLLI